MLLHKITICRAVVFAVGWSIMTLCSGEEMIADIHQGTNMALALAPDRESIVVDLIGQLWEIPVTGGAATPLTPTDEPARNPRYSPDGRFLVYQRETAGQWDLWLLERSSGARRQLTGQPYDEREPDFSPDGQAVIFSSDRAGSYDIWELQLDTGELSQRSRTVGHATFPSLSELGNIAFIHQRGDRWTLEILGADGTSVVLLERPHPLRAPSWRPGGGVILFTEQRGTTASVLTMIVLSEEPVIRTLTDGEDVFGFRPAWLSPAEYLYTADGQIWRRTLSSSARAPILLFAGVGVTKASHTLRTAGHAPAGPQPVRGIRAVRTSSSGRYRAFTALGDLWLQDAEQNLRRLTNDVYIDIDPAFSPDDEFIVFASDRGGKLDLWQISLDTGDLSQLTNATGKSYRPSISPDGSEVVFLRTLGFGPWSSSSLEHLRLQPQQSSRTLADGLAAASTPAWDLDGMGVSVAAVRTAAASDRPVDPAVLRIDLAAGAQRWTPASDAAEATDSNAVTAQDTEIRFADPVIEWLPAEPVHDYVVQVDRLFDGVRNQYRRHMDIHVKNGRITNVVTRGLAPLPETVIDAREFTIIPGLIDIHAHHSALGGERLGRAWLAYGITTVRELPNERSEPGDGLERQEAWASGKRLGPRLLLSSSASERSGITGAGGSRRDYDVLEIHSGQPVGFADASLRVARALGLPIFSGRLLPAARFGTNGIEHIGSRREQRYSLERSSLNRTYQDIMSILTQTQTVVTPALAAFGGFQLLAAEQPRWRAETAYADFFHAYERAGWRAQPLGSESLSRLQQTVAELVHSGGRIAAGSDAPTVPYGLGLHAELALLAEAGLANDQVLRLATSGAALALGLERDLGAVEAGRLADFVVLSGDPLTRIGDSLRIEATVRNGVWFDRRELLDPR